MQLEAGRRSAESWTGVMQRSSPGGLGSGARCGLLAAALVRGNAVQDGGRVALDDAGDLRPAVVAMGVVADEPPELVPGGCYGLGSLWPAEFLGGDAAASANGIDQFAKAPSGECSKDGVWMRSRGHGGLSSEGRLDRGCSDISRWPREGRGRRCGRCGTDGAAD